MIQQTSLNTWKNLQGIIGERQAQVYNALKKLGEANNYEIAKEAKLPINSTTPRILELRKMGLVYPAGKKPGKPSNRTTLFWKTKQNTKKS